MRRRKFRGNVFVSNLPPGVTDAQLAEAFEPYGIVIAAYVARDPDTSALKTFGLVDIAPERAAAIAVAAMNGAEIGGKRIEARRADPEKALAIPAPRIGPAPRSHHRPPANDTRPAFAVEHRRLPPRA